MANHTDIDTEICQGLLLAGHLGAVLATECVLVEFDQAAAAAAAAATKSLVEAFMRSGFEPSQATIAVETMIALIRGFALGLRTITTPDVSRQEGN